MNKPMDLPQRDFNDEDSNTSSNPSFESVLAARLSRRHILRGGVGAAATAVFGGLSVAACGGGDDDPAASDALLGFTAVSKSLEDKLTVPAGYTASVLIAVGDPIAAGVAAYKNDGTDAGYGQRSGDNHDGMEYFGLSASGAPDPSSNDRALLGTNHEYINQVFLHANGPTANPRPASETDIEVDCHGVSIVEIAKNAGKFTYVQNSAFNRRITAATEIEISGPVRGHALLVTKFSTAGTKTRGTVNNCGTGKTPWGTLLTGEENWVGYYFRAAGDPALRGAKGNTALVRYGSVATASAAAASRYGWETSGTEDKYARWNTSVIGASTDGSDDYRHEVNGQGYVTEIDPYNAASVIKKRTALGRMAHESAAFSKPVVGKPLAIYMGDDARNEYIYKFVSTQNWVAADATASDRVAVGDKYLDSGKLYAAKFNADGTGQWIELSLSTPAIAAYATYAFADAGDVAMHSRIAGDAVGATKMDRPEWCGVHPTTGEIYYSLTNNSNRRLGAVTGSQLNPDAANPRVYTDIRGTSTTQSGNPNGHILRVKEDASNPAATAFTWDIYLFGAQADAPTDIVNLSSLTADQDFSSPDGLVFVPSTGLCWGANRRRCLHGRHQLHDVGRGAGHRGRWLGDDAGLWRQWHRDDAHGQEADGLDLEALPCRTCGPGNHRPVRDAGRQSDLPERPASRRGHASSGHRRPDPVPEPLARQCRLRRRGRHGPAAGVHRDGGQERTAGSSAAEHAKETSRSVRCWSTT